jgi:hypothetical protein
VVLSDLAVVVVEATSVFAGFEAPLAIPVADTTGIVVADDADDVLPVLHPPATRTAATTAVGRPLLGTRQG